MLEIAGLSAWYGEARVLQNISLSVHAGEVVTLVGRNGAGKTTLLRSVMGLHRPLRRERAGPPVTGLSGSCGSGLGS